jgi:Na+/citrate or Na+/malate symporter
MSNELLSFLHNRQWIIVLVLGIFAAVFGFTVALINGINLQSNMSIIIPILFAGWGIGYLMCVKTIRDLEKKR